ncbi:uncharacterized protein LA080_003750 [Diaporthe eres]|nr:uncharacterized protein LA080_003750 [Diaporthe eres]
MNSTWYLQMACALGAVEDSWVVVMTAAVNATETQTAGPANSHAMSAALANPCLFLGRCSEEEMPEFPFTDGDLRSKGLRNIAKASDILAGSPASYWHLELRDEIQTTERFIHEGCLD